MADPSNSKDIAIGHGTATASCLFVMAPGVGIDLEVDNTVAIYAYAVGGGSQNIQWIEVAGTP